MPKKTADFETRSVTFEFDEDEKLVASLEDFPPEMITHLALHGLSQKCGDSYAGAAKAIEGLEITANEYAKNQVAGVIKQLKDGDWTVRSGGGGSVVTDLAKALSEFTGQPLDTCVSILAEKEKDERAAVRKHPGIAAILSRLSAERAAAKAEKAAKEAGEAEMPELVL